MKEIIQEGKNVEEAIELACKALNVDRDIIEFEIIDLQKKGGFLGLKNIPAKVRVYVEEPEKPAEKPEVRPEPKPARQEAKPKPQPVREEKAAAEKPAPAPQEEKEELVFADAQTVTGKAKVAADYVMAVLLEMGVNAHIEVALTQSGGAVLRLSGDGLGVIIGRRGETLDSLQYLSGLVANREEGDYMRITIDSGNYREKRERTLERLATKLSNTAIRYGRSSTLEPMNPYERRIIHATVSKIDGVTSTSIGEEPNRRVVISPTNPRPQQGRGSRGGRYNNNRGPRKDNRDSRGPRRDHRDNRDRGGNRTVTNPGAFSETKAAQPKEHTAPTKPMKEVVDAPLYGKIDL